LINVPSDRAGEVQEVPQRIFDTLQGDVGVRHLTEIEEQVVQRLQDVMTATHVSTRRRQGNNCSQQDLEY